MGTEHRRGGGDMSDDECDTAPEPGERHVQPAIVGTEGNAEQEQQSGGQRRRGDHPWTRPEGEGQAEYGGGADEQTGRLVDQ